SLKRHAGILWSTALIIGGGKVKNTIGRLQRHYRKRFKTHSRNLGSDLSVNCLCSSPMPATHAGCSCASESQARPDRKFKDGKSVRFLGLRIGLHFFLD